MGGFDPGQPRGEHGRWTSSGGAAGGRGAKLAQRAEDVAATGNVAGSTVGQYRPGAWTQETTDTRAQRLAESLASQSPEAPPKMLQEMAYERAKTLVPTDVTIYRNGEHTVEISHAVPQERRRELLDAVDAMQTRFPTGERLNVSVRPSAEFEFGVGGETTIGSPNIRLNAKLLRPFTSEGHWPGMPASTTVSQAQYVLAHEWGHAVNSERYTTPTDLPAAKARVTGMSDYGNSSPYEAYAEAFAEWSLTGGKTTNVAARQYAADYGWAKRWPKATEAAAAR